MKRMLGILISFLRCVLLIVICMCAFFHLFVEYAVSGLEGLRIK